MTDPAPDLDLELRALLGSPARAPDAAFARRIGQRVRVEARGRDRVRATAFRFARDVFVGLTMIACVLVAPLLMRDADSGMVLWIIAGVVCAWVLGYDWSIPGDTGQAQAGR